MPLLATLPPSLAEPAISPDGLQIAFVSGGDIWIAPIAGGPARPLVSHPSADSRPIFSPDGARLAFISDRTGNGDIYVLTITTGHLLRLTFDDWQDELSAWSPDGRYVYFSNSSYDISTAHDVYRVPADGGTPIPVLADRYAGEYFAVPAPHGDELAFVANGENTRKWFRHGHSAKDASDIYIRRPGPVYQRLTAQAGKNLWPMWSPDAKSLYFVSDRDGNENIWVTPRSGAPARPLTRFRNGRLLWPSISRNGRQIAFEREFAIWLADTATGKCVPLPITLPAPIVNTAKVTKDVSGQIEELAVSPDGRRLAFTARGEVFVAPKEGGAATRITSTAAAESGLAWDSRGQTLAYVSERHGNSHLFLYDFSASAERQLTSSPLGDRGPAWSPDGRSIAFVRGSTQLVVLDTASNQERILVSAAPRTTLSRLLSWSPDGRWIGIVVRDASMFQNVSVVSINGGPAHAVSRLAHPEAGSLSWHPNGLTLFFDTGIDREGNSLARVDLGATSSLSQIPTEGLHRRLRILPLGLTVQYLHAVSPDGLWVAFLGNAAGQSNVYIYSLDESAPAASPLPLSAKAASRRGLQFSPDSKQVFFIENGRIQVAALRAQSAQTIPVTAEVEIDFEQEKLAVFAQAWQSFQTQFYDPLFHGVDWRAARDRFLPWAQGARSAGELRRIIALMIGELNVSHLAIAGPDFAPPRLGRLGVRLHPEGPNEAGRLRIAEVITDGPAGAAGIKAGEWIAAIAKTPLTPRASLDELLLQKIRQNVIVTIIDTTGASREVSVRPTDVTAEKQLLYRDWVESRRAYVQRASGGRLGYVHLYNMDGPSLTRLYQDLDADSHASQGVVVDIRGNYGGNVDGFVLDILTRKNYQSVLGRNGETGQQRHQYSQRALGRPTILVTNSHTISDGESLAEGYRRLKAGLVVGQPTAGEVIMSRPVTLVDDTGLLMPGSRILDNDGTDMEGHPRKVDIRVDRPIGESLTGQDRQLDAAVRHLLSTLFKQPAKPASR